MECTAESSARAASKLLRREGHGDERLALDELPRGTVEVVIVTEDHDAGRSVVDASNLTNRSDLLKPPLSIPACMENTSASCPSGACPLDVLGPSTCERLFFSLYLFF